jgi:hypothetical protein
MIKRSLVLVKHYFVLSFFWQPYLKMTIKAEDSRKRSQSKFGQLKTYLAGRKGAYACNPMYLGSTEIRRIAV